MKFFVWTLLPILVVLHQVNAFAADATLVFGFLPANLAYHAAISLAAAATWSLAARYAWPLDDADEPA